MNRPTLLTALGLALLAAASHFLVGHWVERLPEDYALRANLTVSSRFRGSSAGEWETRELLAERLDNTLSTAGDVLLIQSDVRWTADDGTLLFNNSGIYGVHRSSRENAGGYGGFDRRGQFLPRPRQGRSSFSYWDPMFVGMRKATFLRTEPRGGLLLDVYAFETRRMDETAGYAFLPEVPERARAYTDGRGSLWVEPISGILVDYEDQGRSYLALSPSSAPLADFHLWSERYTPETRAQQLERAQAVRTRIKVARWWAPSGLLLAAGVVALLGWGWGRRRAGTRGGR